jgi:hypothetical protein
MLDASLWASEIVHARFEKTNPTSRDFGPGGVDKDRRHGRFRRGLLVGFMTFKYHAGRARNSVGLGSYSGGRGETAGTDVTGGASGARQYAGAGQYLPSQC